MKHSVILHDYKSNSTKTLREFTDLINASLFVEEFISDYIINLQGDTPYNYLFYPPVLGTTFKDGFYCLMYKNHYNRFTICRRTRYIGWITNSQVDDTHFEIFISSCKSDTKIQFYNGKFETLDLNNRRKFNECLCQIDETFKPNVEHSDPIDILPNSKQSQSQSVPFDLMKPIRF
jgi:hypothetical protein